MRTITNRYLPAFLIFVFITNTACASKSGEPVTPGNDPNFTIVKNTDEGLEICNRKVLVFEIPVYAVPDVADVKLLHAANIMAQYLDNDEDGTVDNAQVHTQLKAANAFMIMWARESDLDISVPDNRRGQDLGNDETIPTFVTNGKSGRFDASLEEVLHLITSIGYANAYPNVFGENPSSLIAKAMDTARGGYFNKVPSSYPSNAWYTYDDNTCDYPCMVTEYFYWALTSILGAQKNRLDEIGQEWRLNTNEKVKNSDSAVYELLTDSQYTLPNILPDGSYRR